MKITNPRGNILSFSIPQFGVQTGNFDSRGGTETIQFVADKAGVFTFMCETHTCQTGYCDPDHSMICLHESY